MSGPLLERRLLTAAELAHLLGISPRTLRRHVKSGAIPSVRIGRLLRFDPMQIESFFLKYAGLSNLKDQ
jgi:excisionase family DNA binding protein